MTNIVAFIGEPQNFMGKLTIYPPKVRDVVANVKFGAYQKILTFSEEDIQEELKKNNPDIAEFPTPFEFLLINCYTDKNFKKLAIEAFEFFCHTKVAFLFEDKKIIIGDVEEIVKNMKSVNDLVYLHEEEFFAFQNAIRASCGEKPYTPPPPPDLNEDPRITRIKMLARERDRIKAKSKKSGGISLDTILVAICCMGIGITPLNIGEMSYVSIQGIMRKYQDKEKYQLDIESLLAGADSKKIKPKYWISNFEE